MEVMEKGKIYTSPLFVVRVYQGSTSHRSDLSTGGISAVAPKKVAPTAVLRNKLRRQIYEAVAPLRCSLIPGVSMIIFAKTETAKADFAKLTPDLKNLFSKAKISV